MAFITQEFVNTAPVWKDIELSNSEHPEYKRLASCMPAGYELVHIPAKLKGERVRVRETDHDKQVLFIDNIEMLKQGRKDIWVRLELASSRLCNRYILFNKDNFLCYVDKPNSTILKGWLGLEKDEECPICFETIGMSIPCTTCGKHTCNSCIEKLAGVTDSDSITLERAKNLTWECPCCRENCNNLSKIEVDLTEEPKNKRSRSRKPKSKSKGRK